MRIGKIVDVGLLVGVAAMTCAMVYIGLQLHQARTPPAPRPALAAGATVPSMEAQEIGGTSALVKFEDDPRPTVIYVFSPTCVWCKRNLDNLKALVSADHGRFRWVGLSTLNAGVNDYLKSNHLGFDEVLVNPSAATMAAYHIGATPETFVVGADHRLLADWRGAFASDPIRSEVQKFFALTLPPWAPIQ